MSEWMAATLVIGLLLVFGVPISWWVLNSGPEPSPRAAARFRERQANPDFEAYRRHFQCEPPRALQALFEEKSLFADDRDMSDVVLENAQGVHRWPVAWIEPVDQEHLDAKRWPGTEGLYDFANDGSGDLYLIDPCEPDPQVYYYEHETGNRRALGISLAQFLSRA